VKSTMTGTVTSSGRGGTAAAMTQNEQTAEEHSTLEQKPPGRLDHPAWCVVWTVQPASTLKQKKNQKKTLFAINNGRLQAAQINTRQDAQLSQRDRAAGCVIVFPKSRRLELGDNILRTV